ncbi:MAG: hypothetical protein RL220_277, partial [Bacteroidota bacterium]
FNMTDLFSDSWNGGTYTFTDQFGNVLATGTHTGGSSSSANIGIGVPNGCTDPSACNYNPAACGDDGSCCYQNCVTVNMTDLFSDSWNGGAYTITDSQGNVVATGTHEGGSSSADVLCLADGCYTIDVTGGTFPSEIGWSLSGANEVVSGGAPATASFSVGAAQYGCTNCEAPNYNPAATCDDGSCLITCTGDFNGDNIIGTSDLLLFLGTFGSTPGPCSQTDLTDDGIVGLADLLLFLGVFGTTCPF